MAELPFLVVHGALVWKASVVGVGALGIKLATWRRDRKSAKFVDGATKHYISTSTGLEPGPILLRGHLRGGGAKSFEHGRLPVIHERDGAAYLDIEGERIDFSGEVVVGSGTDVRTSYWRRTPGAPAADPGMPAGRGPQRLNAVRADDEVLIGGVLKRAAVGDNAYRESGGGWTIEPYPRQGAVGLVAAKHRMRALPVTPLRQVGVFTGFGLIALVGMGMCGGFELAPSTYGNDAIHHRTIAAAMPWTRDDALADLAHAYGARRTPADVDRAIELTEMRFGCSAAINMMLQESRYEQVLDAGERCDLHDRDASALMMLGRYEDALAAKVPPQDSALRQTAAVATGSWAVAAAADPDSCNGLLFASYGGDAKAHATLDARARGGDVRCSLLATRMMGVERAGAAAAAITTDADADTELSRVLADLDQPGNHDETGSRHTTFASDLIDGDGGASQQVWTSRDGDITQARAVFEVYAGRFSRAQEIAGTLIAHAEGGAPLVSAQRFAALIALRAGKPVPAAWLEHDAELDAGSPYMSEPGYSVFQLLRGESYVPGPIGRVAGHGDGHALRTDGDELGLAAGPQLLAYMTTLESNRDEAADFLETVRGSTIEPAGMPFQMIRAASMRRDLARAAGDAEGAKRWQAIVDRHLAVIAHRDRVLGLLVAQ